MADYTYFNINPYGIEEEDCVCRAITAATGVKYYVIDNLLELISELNYCEKLCACCYHILLEDIFEYPVVYCDNGETVGEIIDKHKDDVVIIRISGHLTYAINGNSMDIFDCRDREVDCYWIA